MSAAMEATAAEAASAPLEGKLSARCASSARWVPRRRPQSRLLLQTDHDAQRAIGLLLEMGGAPSGRYGGPPSNAAAHDTTQHV